MLKKCYFLELSHLLGKKTFLNFPESVFTGERARALQT